eukprot:357832-Chlamydomonas_euryale.AAC.10
MMYLEPDATCTHHVRQHGHRGAAVPLIRKPSWCYGKCVVLKTERSNDRRLSAGQLMDSLTQHRRIAAPLVPCGHK